MDFGWFLFGFDGRINRAKYWLSLVIFLIGGAFFMMLFFDDVRKFIILENRLGEDIRASAFIPFFVIGVPMLVVGTWLFAATAIKRLHDRNKSGWWMAVFFIVPSLLQKAVDRLGDSNLAFLAGSVALGLCIWGFVETYCLKGTAGTNQFGPDPLSPQKRIGRLMAHR
ncbi:MAG: DUF805 domain-containing protein [Xanthobacteraceae bacterium]|nr:DUF805 domain-containing protein [Xanthobacteraceae bacterium]